MPCNQLATAKVIQFPQAIPRPLRFSREERQALLALAYAHPGTEVSFERPEDDDERCTLEEQGGDGSPWWIIRRTPDGFDVTNAGGYRIKQFKAVGPLLDKMKPAVAYMLNLLILRDSAQAASRTLTVV